MQSGLARAAVELSAVEHELSACWAMYPRVRLALQAHRGEEDCSAANAFMHARARDSASMDAVQRGLARAAVYENADSRQPAVSLPLEAHGGEEDCSAVNALMHAVAQGSASMAAVQRGLARAAKHEAADRLQLPPVRVRLTTHAHAGEQDCSAANASMHARVQDAVLLAVVRRGLARAAVYEAADCLQPSISLPLDAQRGEDDCREVNALMHATAKDSASMDAVQRGLARAAAYEAADCMQPAVSLPLDAQRGEEDCSGVNALMHAWPQDAASMDAVQRGLARAAAYEAADCMQPAVSLPLDAQRGEEDCSGVNALMHAWPQDAASMDAVQRGLARAAVYENADSRQPAVSLPLDSQCGEEDCSVANNLMHAMAEGLASRHAVQRGLARAAAYEAADSLQPAICLPLDVSRVLDDCSAFSALMQGRAAESMAAVQRGLARAAVYELADSLLPSVSLPRNAQGAMHPIVRLPLEMQRGEEDCSVANNLMHARAQDSVSMNAVRRGLARAAGYEAADTLQPAVSLPLDSQCGEEDCSGVNALMHARAQNSASMNAVQRGLARAAVYEIADSRQPAVSLPLETHGGEEDCSTVNALMHAVAQGSASMAAVQRGLARAAKHEAADRLQLPPVCVKLTTHAHAGEQDCSAANASMHARVQDAVLLAVVRRGLARAAVYEAADCLQPSISLPLDAQRGEDDCREVNALMHATAKDSASMDAVQRGLARAAAYEAADCMQPAVSLPLDAQRGEDDCREVNALMHATAKDSASMDAVQRGLARAAAYEAADCMQPAVSLPLDAQRGEDDCREVNALMHARAPSGVRAVLRGLARAGAYEVADLLGELEAPTGHSPSEPNVIVTLSLALWQDMVATSASLHSVEAIAPHMQRLQQALIRERDRQMLRMGDKDHELLRTVSAHRNAESRLHRESYVEPSSQMRETSLAAVVTSAAKLRPIVIHPNPPPLSQRESMKPTFTKPTAARVSIKAALRSPSTPRWHQQMSTSPSGARELRSSRAQEIAQPFDSSSPTGHNKRKHTRKNGKLHKARANQGTTAQIGAQQGKRMMRPMRRTPRGHEMPLQSPGG